MAHSCPACGGICYCNGDCDDILLEDPEAEAACECCLGKDDPEGFDDDYLLDGMPEEEPPTPSVLPGYGELQWDMNTDARRALCRKLEAHGFLPDPPGRIEP